MQIIHRKNEFTAAGFIKLDYKFVTSVRNNLYVNYGLYDILTSPFQMIAAVVTYLVVMIQFHDSSSRKRNADIN